MEWLLDVYNYQVVWDYAPTFGFGLWRTVWISLVCLIASLILGTGVALMRRSGSRLVRYPATVFVEALRGTPLLVQIYIVYYSLPVIPGLDRRLSELEGGLLALSIHTAAYMAEIIRAGIASVPSGQREGAMSVGMTRWQTLRHIVLPQAFANVVPPVIGQTAVLIKDSSLLSMIAVFELMSAGLRLMNDRYMPNEAFLTSAACYLLIYMVMLVVSNHVQTRLAGRG